MQPFETARPLRLRRCDQCACCGRELGVGDEAYWYRDARALACANCKAAADAEPAGERFGQGPPSPPWAARTPGVAFAGPKRLAHAVSQTFRQAIGRAFRSA